MAQKVKFNVAVDGAVVDRFREVADAYAGRLGMCLEAAMVQFLESDPKVQGELLTRCFQAEIHDQMQQLIDEAKSEQLRRIREREKKEKGKD